MSWGAGLRCPRGRTSGSLHGSTEAGRIGPPRTGRCWIPAPGRQPSFSTPPQSRPTAIRRLIRWSGFSARREPPLSARTDARPLCTFQMPGTLNALSTFQAREIPVERAQRQMACLSRDRKYQTIRETESGARTEMGKCLPNDVRILQCQVPMVEQQIKRSRQLRSAALVNGIQHPQSFCQDQLRDPSTSFDKLLGRCDLLRLVPNQQAHQEIRVNGAHASFVRIRGYPASQGQLSPAGPRRRAPHGPDSNYASLRAERLSQRPVLPIREPTQARPRASCVPQRGLRSALEPSILIVR